jgi:hypothetical protein
VRYNPLAIGVFPTLRGEAMSDESLEEKKTFSYEEARALLPLVRRVTEDAYRQVEALQGEVDAGRLEMDRAQQRADGVIALWAESLRAEGVEVKGAWLVDFDNGSGYYCWRYPEPGLEFYHSYEEGFRGRMRIQ